MDEGIERIRRLSRQARHSVEQGRGKIDADAEWRESNRSTLATLEAAIPERLRQLADAAEGDLTYEDSAFRSSSATAIRIAWRPATRQAHDVELWLLRESGSVEWRWTMGHREPPIVHRVPASRFDLKRLDELVAALADPERWRGGHPPEV
jgi:hypothetical protein